MGGVLDARARPYLIFVIFSPHKQFLDKIFTHKKGFATKVGKLRQNLILQQNSGNFAHNVTF